jgi:hypothetical protein
MSQEDKESSTICKRIKVTKDNLKYVRTADKNLKLYIELEPEVKDLLMAAANDNSEVNAPSPSPVTILNSLRVEIGVKRQLEVESTNDETTEIVSTIGDKTTTTAMWKNLSSTLEDGHSLQHTATQETIHTVNEGVFDYKDTPLNRNGSLNGHRHRYGRETFDNMSELSVRTLSVFSTRVHHKTEKTFIAKEYDGKLFTGYCDSFRNHEGRQLYKVVYKDGDSEEMSVRSFVHAAELYDMNRYELSK